MLRGSLIIALVVIAALAAGFLGGRFGLTKTGQQERIDTLENAISGLSTTVQALESTRDWEQELVPRIATLETQLEAVTKEQREALNSLQGTLSNLVAKVEALSSDQVAYEDLQALEVRVSSLEQGTAKNLSTVEEQALRLDELEESFSVLSHKFEAWEQKTASVTELQGLLAQVEALENEEKTRSDLLEELRSEVALLKEARGSLPGGKIALSTWTPSIRSCGLSSWKIRCGMRPRWTR